MDAGAVDDATVAAGDAADCAGREGSDAGFDGCGGGGGLELIVLS